MKSGGGGEWSRVAASRWFYMHGGQEHCPAGMSTSPAIFLSWFSVFSYTKNIKHADDKKFICVSSCQKNKAEHNFAKL